MFDNPIKMVNKPILSILSHCAIVPDAGISFLFLPFLMSFYYFFCHFSFFSISVAIVCVAVVVAVFDIA